MKLTKAQRQDLRERFGGRCAYCGHELGSRWHADHVEAVIRKLHYQKGKGFVQTGEMYNPARDAMDNMMPSCASCNIDKSVFDLETWRDVIRKKVEVLNRYHPAYRHAVRFGLVQETGASVVFHFERMQT